MTVMRLEADVLGPYGRNTAKGALSILMGFPGNSWGGAFPSWRIMLLHEIQALSALCFPAGRRWIQSSQGTQNWQSGQQSLVWAEWRIQVHVQKARVPLGSPAIIEWLRVSESAAQIYDHTFRCIGLGTQFWKCWHRALLPQQTEHSSRFACLHMIFTQEEVHISVFLKWLPWIHRTGLHQTIGNDQG